MCKLKRQARSIVNQSEEPKLYSKYNRQHWRLVSRRVALFHRHFGINCTEARIEYVRRYGSLLQWSRLEILVVWPSVVDIEKSE